MRFSCDRALQCLLLDRPEDPAHIADASVAPVMVNVNVDIDLHCTTRGRTVVVLVTQPVLSRPVRNKV